MHYENGEWPMHTASGVLKILSLRSTKTEEVLRLWALKVLQVYQVGKTHNKGEGSINEIFRQLKEI